MSLHFLIFEKGATHPQRAYKITTGGAREALKISSVES